MAPQLLHCFHSSYFRVLCRCFSVLHTYHRSQGVVQGGLDGDAVAIHDDDAGNVLDVGDPPQDDVQVGGDGDLGAPGTARITRRVRHITVCSEKFTNFKEIKKLRFWTAR